MESRRLRERLRALSAGGAPPAPTPADGVGLWRIEEALPSPGAPEEELLFFDIETWSRSGEARIFLLGYAHWSAERLLVTQDLARDRAEEALCLAAALERFRACPRLVTYNGKSFDLPFVRRRLHHHRLVGFPEGASVEDLLHAARKRFRSGQSARLPDHRLATLERELLGLARGPDDVPGAEVPLRYEDYLETGDASHLDPVIVHNRQDLLSMVALYPLLGRCAPEG